MSLKDQAGLSPATAIPYRDEGGPGAQATMDVFAVVAALLAAAMAAVFLAKRRGLLPRWMGPRVLAQGTLRLESSLRLSPRTVAYVLSDGNHRQVVVESTANIACAPGTTAESGDDA
ncbi:hypothetical protein [Arenimonas terrae]|uniref:Uncharacterized protein n=1 Tax=Arenimonas terrae TaxID=2546226 RepID=A0A5C4RPT3_9GAMM|nr:hypothetical protein [Arenimonas terrae]TNJ33226.1 hypothetical protein E1B00_13080 [Arenimonas terrae]